MSNAERTIATSSMTSTEPQQQVKLAAEVFNKHAPVILATIRSHINDQAEANDILHDFFLSLVYKPVPKHIHNIKSYLQRAVINDVLDASARSKCYKARIQKYADYHKDSTTYQDPQNIAIQAEQTQKMLELIEKQLPRCEAQAVIERCYYERNTEETAERMCVNKRSVSRYLCVGLRKVRSLMAEASISA